MCHGVTDVLETLITCDLTRHRFKHEAAYEPPDSDTECGTAFLDDTVVDLGIYMQLPDLYYIFSPYRSHSRLASLFILQIPADRPSINFHLREHNYYYPIPSQSYDPWRPSLSERRPTMVLAAHLMAILAVLISQSLATMVAEGSVSHCSINVLAGTTFSAQKTAVCGIPITASGAARRTGSIHVPLTINGPIAETTSPNEVFDISNLLSGELPTCGTFPVDGIGFSGSGPVYRNNGLEIDYPVFDTNQDEKLVALSLDRQRITIPLTIDGPPIVDTPLVNGEIGFCHGSLVSNVLSIIDGPIPATPATDFESHSQTQNVPLTIDGPALNNHHVDVKAFFISPMQSMRETGAISTPIPDAKNLEKKAAPHHCLHSTMPLTIDGPMAEKTFANSGASTTMCPQESADSGGFTETFMEGMLISGENSSSNDYTQFRQPKVFLQIPISGVVPLGRSPDPVPDTCM